MSGWVHTRAIELEPGDYGYEEHFVHQVGLDVYLSGGTGYLTSNARYFAGKITGGADVLLGPEREWLVGGGIDEIRFRRKPRQSTGRTSTLFDRSIRRILSDFASTVTEGNTRGRLHQLQSTIRGHTARRCFRGGTSMAVSGHQKNLAGYRGLLSIYDDLEFL